MDKEEFMEALTSLQNLLQWKLINWISILNLTNWQEVGALCYLWIKVYLFEKNGWVNDYLEHLWITKSIRHELDILFHELNIDYNNALHLEAIQTVITELNYRASHTFISTRVHWALILEQDHTPPLTRDCTAWRAWLISRILQWPIFSR